jgi:hypothetical protein
LQIDFEDSLESQAVILLARADWSGGFATRPRERRETSEQDLFRSRLDQIIDREGRPSGRDLLGHVALRRAPYGHARLF